MILEKVQAIKEELDKATLVAVTKKRSISDIMELYQTGHRIFGENRAQELTQKIQQLPSDIKWHMIGHLQTNKVKEIIGKIDLIQSVDSLKLLNTINKEASKIDVIQNILLQVHIAEETNKYGFQVSDLLSFFSNSEYQNYPNLKFYGLMGMATYTNDKDQIANEFATLNTLFWKIEQNEELQFFNICSMGMSGDYPIALQMGSNMVRIGSKIFS